MQVDHQIQAGLDGETVVETITITRTLKEYLAEAQDVYKFATAMRGNPSGQRPPALTQDAEIST